MSNTIIKPMRPSDTIIEKIQYPVIAQPKADGICGVTQHGVGYSRTLKPFANRYTQKSLSNDLFNDFHYEIYVGNITDQDLCRNTTSALNSHEGEPSINLMVFDLLRSSLPYQARLYELETRLRNLAFENVKLVDWVMCYSEDHLLDLETMWLEQGYEGVIVRTLDGGYKEGKVGKTNPISTRIKRFTDSEAVVTALVEAEENLNEKQINELGVSFRSSHQENKIGKSSVGSLICTDVLTGNEITVGPGAMTHAERDTFWLNPDTIVGKTIKYKSFMKGVKNLPRFPTYLSIRADWDLQ
jgi:DNA ligase-1